MCLVCASCIVLTGTNGFIIMYAVLPALLPPGLRASRGTLIQCKQDDAVLPPNPCINICLFSEKTEVAFYGKKSSMQR